MKEKTKDQLIEELNSFKAEYEKKMMVLDFLKPMNLCPCGCGKVVTGRPNKKHFNTLCTWRARNKRMRIEAKQKRGTK